MNAYFAVISALGLLVILSLTVSAQSTTTGAIGGTVSDPNRAVVIGATVSVRDVDTNRESKAMTNDEGRFRIPELPPGAYTVKISVQHFNPFVIENILVEVGRVTTVDASLSLRPEDFGTVTISNTPVINTTQPDVSANINQTSLNELPINGRRWSNFALGTPTAVPDGGFGLVSFRGISGLLNNNTIDGGDNNQAFFSEERGRTRIGYAIGLDSIREFQVNVSNYSAEYGRAAGGVVNAITKSGTNEFHGSAFYYDRDSKLGARNPRGFQNVLINGVPSVLALKPIDKREQFGGTVGGPIVRNKLFFFFSYDQQKRNFPGIATTSDPAFFTTVNRGTTGAGLKAPNRLLTESQIDSTITFLTGLLGEVPRRGDQKIILPKVDWNINGRNTLTGTYNRMRWTSPAGIQTNPIVNFGRQSFGDDFVNVDSLNLRFASRIRSALVNEVLFQYGRDNEFEFSQTPAAGEPTTGPNGKPPQIFLNGGFTLGKPTFLERRAFPDEKRWQIADTLTLGRGNHTLKFGFDFNHVNDLLDNLSNEEGAYNYSTINDFIVDYVNFTTNGSLRSASRVCSGSTRIAGQCYNGNFLQAFGPTAFRFNTNDYNLFFQDDFRVGPRLTLNLGLRYEYEQLPKPQISNALPNLSGQTFGPEQSNRLPSDKNNFGPRLGFAYDLKGNGKTSIRGGYGIYYGRIINSTISNAITNTGVTQAQRVFQINPATNPSGAPIFPSTLASASGTTTPANIIVFDPKMNNPLIHEGDVVFERLVATNTVVSASYIFSLGRSLPTFIDSNLPVPTTRTYTISGGDFSGETLIVPFFASPRPDIRFGGITAVQSLIRSKYNALVLQVNRRLTRGLQLDSNYTLSRATDNGQASITFTTTNTPFDPLDLSLDEAAANFDTRHKFVARAIWSPRFFGKDGKVAPALFNGFTFSPDFVAVSGSTYSAGTSGNPAGGVSGGLTAAGSALNHVPPFSRNFFRQPKIVNVDLRISRRFYFSEKVNLAVVAEVFNLFNRTQVTGLNTRLYIIGGTATASTLTFDPAFGTISATGNGLTRERQVQLAMRFEF